MNVLFALDDTLDAQHHAAVVDWIKFCGGKLFAGKYTHDDGTVVREASYMLSEEDFDRMRGFSPRTVAGQESFLYITSCNKQYATLVYANGDRETLGSMHSVTQKEAMDSPAFSLDYATGNYFVCKQGNPDKESPEARNQRKLWAAVDTLLDGGFDDAWDALRELEDVRAVMKPKWL